MFKIFDGREYFYQWDTEQKLIVSDELVKEVHFSNAVTNPALVCEVFEEDGNRVVNVPNILLQQDWNIKAYGCCDLCVRQYAEFEVIRRNKPADYVYTETEIKRYEDLEERIYNLEQGGNKDIDLSGYYTKTETDAAIEEATKENVEWEVIQTVILEANTRTFMFDELQHRLLRLEFIIQNEGGEIVMPAGIITINGKTGMRIAAQKMSAGSPMYRRVELRVEDGLIVGNTSYSRSDNTSYGTETPLGNSYGLDIMNDWKIIEAISYIVNSTDDLPVGTEIVLKGVRA